MNPEALALFKQQGCTATGTNARMGRDWIMEIIGKAPAQFTITPRNADRTIPVGGGHMVFGNVSSPPNYSDL